MFEEGRGIYCRQHIIPQVKPVWKAVSVMVQEDIIQSDPVVIGHRFGHHGKLCSAVDQLFSALMVECQNRR